MCGIVGYTGAKQAAPLLLEGLSKLEYRGYDSAGVATRDGDAPVQLVKAKGRLKVLSEKINGGLALPGSCGIGHTRWATHGEPSEINAHPHCSDDMNVVAVHNLVHNASLLVERGLGNALTLEPKNVVRDKLCFRPLNPPLESGSSIVWKKYQVFSSAAEAFLERIREKFGGQG